MFPQTEEFFSAIGITQTRWNQIYNGEVQPTYIEAEAIGEYCHNRIFNLIRKKQNEKKQSGIQPK